MTDSRYRRVLPRLVLALALLTLGSCGGGVDVENLGTRAVVIGPAHWIIGASGQAGPDGTGDSGALYVFE